MSSLAPLLEIQEFDLSADRLRQKRDALPERAALSDNEAAIAALDVARDTARAQREALAKAEREIGGEVSTLASKCKEIEGELYSGTVSAAKELDALQHELDLFKAKQEEAELSELELLEQIETADTALSAQDAEHSELSDEGARLTTAIAVAEAEIDDAIGSLEGEAGGLREGLPAPVLATYDRLRASPRLAGRAVVPLGSGECTGCRLDLPVLEYRRLLDEPEDAVLCCVHCTRLFVR